MPTFVADDKFADVVAALERRGWERAPPDAHPLNFDLKWRNLAKINLRLVRPDQTVNHFRNAQHLSSKALLAGHLRVLGELHGVSVSYPSCWNLQSPAQAAQFLWAAGVVAARGGDSPLAALPALPPPQEALELLRAHAAEWRAAVAGPAFPEYEPGTDSEAERNLDPHIGPRRLWIVKPAALSCGRGVQCAGSVAEVARLAAELEFKCVVQKYIERPLLLPGGLKFDIRHWVLVTSVNPLEVYEFERSYLRLALAPYSAAALDDRFAHLCNNSVQKDAPDFAARAAESMWDTERFAEHVGRDAWEDRVRPAIHAAVVDTLRAVQHVLERKGRGFEWLGFDFMLDEALGVHLLEVNTSPDMSHSTPTTAALVPAAVEDCLGVVLPEEEGGRGDGLRWQRTHEGERVDVRATARRAKAIAAGFESALEGEAAPALFEEFVGGPPAAQAS